MENQPPAGPSPEPTPTPSPAQSEPPKQPLGKAAFDPSKIYATPMSNPQDATKMGTGFHQPNASNEPVFFTYSDGYAIGSRIFWYQLLVGFLTGIISSAILRGAATSGSISVIRLVAYFVQVASIIVAVYVSRYVIESEGVPLPGWRAIFGSCLESILGLGISLIYTLVFLSSIFSGNRLAEFLGASTLILWPIFVIIALAISYYVTKISYGYTFQIFAKNNGNRVKLLTYLMVAAIIVLWLLGVLLIRLLAKAH